MYQMIKKCLTSIFVIISISLCFLGCNNNTNKTTAEIIGIDLVGSIKTNYYVGDELNLNNAKLRVAYDNDTQNEINLLSTMIYNFNTNTLGNYTLKITYKGFSINKNYTVTAVGNYNVDEEYGCYVYNSTNNNPSHESFSYVDGYGNQIDSTYYLSISQSGFTCNFIRNSKDENGLESRTSTKFYGPVVQTGNTLTCTEITTKNSEETKIDKDMEIIITVNKSYVEMKIIQTANKIYNVMRFIRSI